MGKRTRSIRKAKKKRYQEFSGKHDLAPTRERVHYLVFQNGPDGLRITYEEGEVNLDSKMEALKKCCLNDPNDKLYPVYAISKSYQRRHLRHLTSVFTDKETARLYLQDEDLKKLKLVYVGRRLFLELLRCGGRLSKPAFKKSVLPSVTPGLSARGRLVLDFPR